MSIEVVPGYSREALWARLEEKGYFDWCRKYQYKQLQDLFFEGTVVDEPEEFIKCRQLIWSPIQSKERWQKMLDRAQSYLSEKDGTWKVVEDWRDSFLKDKLDTLLQWDQQCYGMSVQTQLELLDFLGADIKLENRSVYVKSWLVGIRRWLKAEDCGYQLLSLPDCRYAYRLDMLYGLIDSAPVEIRNGKGALTNADAIGWGARWCEDFYYELKDLYKLIVKPRLLKGLTCDPAPRQKLIETLLSDLETGKAPAIMCEAWQIAESKRKK